MKYVLMMHSAGKSWDEDGLGSWPPEAMEAHLAFLRAFNAALVESGELVQIVALVSPEEMRMVRAKTGGGATITDGPYPESKEFLAGFWMIDVESLDRALELAAQASAGPGPDGKPLNMPIQVRAVMGGPGQEM
ncbi:YciI family protein [Phenylobacterium sp.]|uniref:YciI family protein n=1 Tax=Phenylobacterium sp. TaxID=1871053 RepID=UPI00286BB503|nr:YciI family protein [Phenylobacterium sp.]